MQPVGKSGPLTNFINSGIVMSGLSICAQMPSMTSPRLCGGMLVAMPTAMPVPPLTSRFGKRRENGRFGRRFVVVRNEIDRILVHVLHERRAEMRQARFGITHGRRRIAFDGTEIALAIDQPFAHRPGLGHVNERRINDRFAVRMVVTAWCRRRSWRTYDACRFGNSDRSCIAKRMRRCEGFRPSRTSGSAREMITDIE